jgi:hypothetical protein
LFEPVRGWATPLDVPYKLGLGAASMGYGGMAEGVRIYSTEEGGRGPRAVCGASDPGGGGPGFVAE